MNIIRTQIHLARLLVPVFVWLGGIASELVADAGHPMAIRNWPGGTVSIETHWGLKLVIGNPEDVTEIDDRQQTQVISPSDVVDHVLGRPPNATTPTWSSASETGTSDSNAMVVQSIESAGANGILRIDVDGAQIVYVPSQWLTDAASQASVATELEGIVLPELVILGASDRNQLSNPSTVAMLEQVKPQQVLLNRINLRDTASVAEVREHLGAERVRQISDRNTIALGDSNADQGVEYLLLGQIPWQMPASLEALFVAMEKSNQTSQQVFAPLSATQMNFKPANGTHTPRWNTEHMMGRQLLFFSQIYHSIDSTIPVIDLNPRQMPPDYVFAHPEWEGAEEARQMQRANEFSRRFAYLLDGVPLDIKAPGSRWTLRGLLKQMQRHYSEHTANTIKKFELPGWPEE